MLATLAVIAGALGIAPRAGASTDLVAATRSPHPERLWVPLTAADLAAAGAGRAVDPASSWMVNPALLSRPDRSSATRVRLAGTLVDPKRNDVQAETQAYSDDSPHFFLGESGIVLSGARLSFGATYGFDAFHKEQATFIDPSPSEVVPISGDHRARASLERLSAGAAYAATSMFTVGAAVELVRSREEYERDPLPVSEPFVVQAEQTLSGQAFRPVLGVAVRAADWVTAGASARLGAEMDLEDDDGEVVGTDEAPARADLGLWVGRGTGGNLLLGAGYVSEREVALGDSIGRGEERAAARADVAAAYAYRSPTQPWEFRVGFGWSPHPADGGPRSTRFGVGLGYALDATLFRIGWGREGRSEGDRDWARQFITATVEVSL